MSPTARSQIEIAGIRCYRTLHTSQRIVNDGEALCHLWSEKLGQTDHMALPALRLVMLAKIPLPRGFDVHTLALVVWMSKSQD